MYYVIEEKECRECRGEGYIYMPQCQYPGCYRNYDPSEILYEEDFLPCGHDWRHLHTEHPCVECEGEGTIERRVSLKDALGKLLEQEQRT